MKAKYSLGQRVIITQYDRWIGDFENKGIICGFENYVNNGVTVYQVKCRGEILCGVEENQLKKEEH
jgi:hypothetical protein